MALCSHENDYEIMQLIWCKTCNDSIRELVTVCPGQSMYDWTCSICGTEGKENV